MENKTYKRGLRRELPLCDDMSDVTFLRTGYAVPAEVAEEMIEIADKFNAIGCTSFRLTKEQMNDALNKLRESPMTQIIETMLEADTLLRIPKKIKVSPNMYQVLNSACEKKWIASIEDEMWEGIPIEIDLDLFGYTYEPVY